MIRFWDSRKTHKKCFWSYFFSFSIICIFILQKQKARKIGLFTHKLIKGFSTSIEHKKTFYLHWVGKWIRKWISKWNKTLGKNVIWWNKMRENNCIDIFLDKYIGSVSEALKTSLLFGIEYRSNFFINFQSSNFQNNFIAAKITCFGKTTTKPNWVQKAIQLKENQRTPQ